MTQEKCEYQMTSDKWRHILIRTRAASATISRLTSRVLAHAGASCIVLAAATVHRKTGHHNVISVFVGIIVIKASLQQVKIVWNKSSPALRNSLYSVLESNNQH